MSMRKYSTVVYDLDGTLVDSAPCVTALLNELRMERSLPPLAQSAYTPWLSIGGATMVAAALGISEANAQPLLHEFRAKYFQRPTPPDSVYPEVHTILQQLQRAGIGLALCTNKPRLLVEKVLAETGLTRFFTTICTGDDLPTRKPHPDNLLSCMRAVRSHCGNTLMVGDSRVDQRVAQACKTDFAFFTGGYNDGVEHGACVIKIANHTDVMPHIRITKERSPCEQL